MAAADASRMALSADDVSPAPGHTTPSWVTAEVPSSPPGLSLSSADAGSIWGAVSGGGWLAGGARATSIGGSSAGSALIPSRGSGLVKASPEQGASLSSPRALSWQSLLRHHARAIAGTDKSKGVKSGLLDLTNA